MSFKTIGIARETESPENPGCLDKRVAVIPSDVARLVQNGVQVFVEYGAGERIGFSDDEYLQAGALLQSHEEVYRGKELLIKFKGPSMQSISWMDAGSTLFCMAHFHSFPERAKLLEQKQINVVAMEQIVESPKILRYENILSKVAMQQTLGQFESVALELNVGFIGWSTRLAGAIRRAGNRFTNTLNVYASDVHPDELQYFGDRSIYVYDSSSFKDVHGLIDYLKSKQCCLLDISEFEGQIGAQAVQEYLDTHPPFRTGLRRIQCLHETGQAGARYGFKLLAEVSKKKLVGKDVNCVVLGYGNVGMGAIHECFAQGARRIYILGYINTKPDRIERFLLNADLIVNGAEQPVELRGKNYLLTRQHVKDLIADGSVVIDLVGGSASNRSAVENVIECTFLNDPYFEEDGVYFSALWGWPMMGMMRETAVKYSSQIVDVLLGRERLIDGLGQLHQGVEPALVCGPFEKP